MHYEAFDEITYAIEREKQLKAWRREWKITLIETANAEWRDLAEGWWASNEAAPLQVTSS